MNCTKQEAMRMLISCNGDIVKINSFLNALENSIVFSTTETAEVLQVGVSDVVKIKNNAIRKMKIFARHLNK